MNWSIEQNFILLQFVKTKGENEWLKYLNNLKDLFTIHLTNINDIEYNNFKEDDFKRQYNYILATTKQECLKQNIKMAQTQDIVEIALKKFQNFLEQQNHRDDKLQLQSQIKALEDGRIEDIPAHKLIEMREKVYCVYGEDILGNLYGLDKIDELKLREKREKCLKEITNTWSRRLNDGTFVVAGDNGIFDDEFIEKLCGVTENASTDSDATETLEDLPDPIKLNSKESMIIPYKQALSELGLEMFQSSSISDTTRPGTLKELTRAHKWIAGWRLGDYIEGLKEEKLTNSTDIELDDRFSQWLSDLQQQQQKYLAEEMKSSIVEKLDLEVNCVNVHSNALPPPNSPSNCTTGASVAATTPTTTTVDDLEDSLGVGGSLGGFDSKEPSLTTKKSRKRRNSKRKTKEDTRSAKFSKISDEGVAPISEGLDASQPVSASLTREQESRRKVMRNLLKLIQEHRYSSLLTRSLSFNVQFLFKKEVITLAKIVQGVNDALYLDYDSFIEQIRLFFLQLKVYYCQHEDIIEKISTVYHEFDKQIRIVCPDMYHSLPISHWINRRESRFKGNYS